MRVVSFSANPQRDCRSLGNDKGLGGSYFFGRRRPEGVCPHGGSNPGLGLERAMS